MNQVYPAILIECGDSIAVSIPDLSIDTQGKDIAEAIYMARDAIGMIACYEQDEGRDVMQPSSVKSIVLPEGATMALIDIDIDAYRRAHENRTIRKNVTIPSWLNDMGENAGLNFSQVLTDGLKQRLDVE